MVIAGRSEPGARIEILDGNTVIGIVDSDDRGAVSYTHLTLPTKA